MMNDKGVMVPWLAKAFSSTADYKTWTIELRQGIYYTDFDRNWSALIIGVLLLVAVLMNNTFRKMALSYAPKKGAK